MAHYNSLQERFHHSSRPGGAVPASQVQKEEEDTKLQAPEQIDATAQVMAELKEKLLEKEKTIKELEHFKSDFESSESQLEDLQKQMKEKVEELKKIAKTVEELKENMVQKEKAIKELEHYKSDFEAAQTKLEDLQKQMDEKVEELKKNIKTVEDSGAKNLKQKAQLTAKVKALEKENGDLKVSKIDKRKIN